MLDISAQTQVYPVQVTGSLIPPHSLDLKVYGTDRSTDLSFNALLKDPTQAFLSVVPRITIEQSGTVIYGTDPNFVGEQLILSQFENQTIDGVFLNKYLSNAALSGIGGQGMGSVEIPEGFNQVCLQFYGVVRNVAVSNKFCVSGNFRLNQPPQIVKPAFNEKIKIPPVQSTIFSWQPMHLGSGNNPGLVEYTFEIVELPMGVMNANDVFETALKVYNTTTNATSLLYTQAEPILEAGKIYAWRVTAKSVMYPTSKLFQNDGKSEISTFIMYDGDVPSDLLNPLDNPSPRGCSVFETSYGPVIKADNQPSLLIPNQTLKVGYFNMVTSQVNGGLDGYSGKGWIEYPMLRSKIEVTFENIRVNKDGRVYEAELIEAVMDPTLKLTNDQLRSDVIATNLNGNYSTKLYKSITNSKKVKQLSEGNLKSTSLPLALENEEFSNAMVCVTGIRFTTNNAFLTLIGLENATGASSRNIKGEDISVSAATAIQATPFGIKNGAYLVPVSGSSSGNVAIMSTVIKAVSMEKDSRVLCDCNGYKKSETKEDLYISSNILVNKDNGSAVKLPLKDTKQPADTYYGDINKLSDFRIQGIDDYAFTSGGGQLNLDSAKSLAGLPEGVGTGKVLWLKNNKLELPSKYALGADKKIELSGDLIIGEEYIEYGNFKKSDVIPLSKGIIEKWRYSVDEMSIAYENGSMSPPKFSGKVQLPVSSYLANYTGTIINPTKGNPVLSVDALPAKLPIEMWKGEMALEPNSSLLLEIKNISEEQKVYPSASLSGTFSMKVDQKTLENSIKGNAAQTVDDIKKVFNISAADIGFELSGIKISDWNFEPYISKENKYIPAGVDVSNAKFNIGSKSYDVTGAEVIYPMEDQERLGLSFTTIANNNKISFVIWAVEKNGQLVFESIEKTSFELNCDCTTGKAIGFLDFDPVYDKIIKNQYLPHLSESRHAGGTSSYLEGLSAADAIAYKLFKTQLQENTNGDFVLADNNTLYWPLLDKNITISKEGNKIKLVNDIILDKDLFAKLGIKAPYNVPVESRLTISDFIINDWKEKGAEAKVQFELIAPYLMANQTFENSPNKLIFQSNQITAAGNSIELVNVKMALLAPQDGKKTYDAEEYYWLLQHPVTKVTSHAMLDCTEGIKYIELFGVASIPDLNAVSTQKQAEIPFSIRVTQSSQKISPIIDFIGVCDDYLPSAPNQKWEFQLPDQKQISFNAGEGYKIFFDNSAFENRGISESDKKAYPATASSSFKGIVFEKSAYQLAGFMDKNNKKINFEHKGSLYLLGQTGNEGYFSTVSDANVIKSDAGYSMDGWKYSIDTISFKIKSSKFSENVSIAGWMNLPLFKLDPTNDYKDHNFERGRASFKGEIITKNQNISSTIGFRGLKNKLFQSILVPGMAMKLDENSAAELKYSDNEWKPFGEFSGKSNFYMNNNVALSLNIVAPDGIDMSTSKISFENVIVSSYSFDDAIKIKLDGDNICYVALGKWGDVDSKSLAEIDAVEDLDQRVNHVQNVNNNVKAKPKATTPSNKSKTSNKDDKSSSQFLGFDLVSTCLGPKKRGDEIVMGLEIKVGLMGVTKEELENGVETKSQFIKAEGVVGLSYSPTANGQDIWKFSGVTLECLAVSGQLGPIGFDGGLNILRSNPEYGSGLKGYLSADIEGLGGLNIVGQFGKKKDSGDEYYYGFLDLEAFSEQGIPLPPPTPVNPPVIDFFGAGGGLAINMKIKNANEGDNKEFEMPPASDTAKKNDEVKAAEERKAKIKSAKEENTYFCDNVGGDFMQPGVGLMQAYTPEQGTIGANFFLIFGPYQPSPKPPYSLVADAGLSLEINLDPNTNEFTFGSIAIKARGYLMPASIRERRSNNLGDVYAAVTFDWRKKLIDAEVSFRSKFETPAIAGMKPMTVWSMPVNYDETDFATRKGYNTANLKISFDPDNPYGSLKLGGPGTDPNGLDYISAKFAFLPEIKAYAQIGAYVDAPPRLEDMIPELANLISQKDLQAREDSLKKERPEKLDFSKNKASGIAFGLKVEANVTGNYLLLHADLKLKLGLDVNLRQYKNVKCSNSDDGGDIGINGWYAIGKAYAYAQGDIDIGIKFLGRDLTFNIFDASAYVAMEAQGPNPSYFRGMISGKYSVLGGRKKGDFNYKVILGEECEVEVLPDPIADITIFSSSSVSNGQKDVDRYNDISLKTNFPLLKDFTATQRDSKNEALFAVNFMADIKNITVKKKSLLVKQNYIIKPDNKEIVISFEDALQPLTEYTLEYDFCWKVKEGSDATAKYEDHDKTEKGIIMFTTGARPTTIVAGMIEYSAPGDRQRYWHKGYADSEIKFKLKALEDAVTLFPEACVSCSEALGLPKPPLFSYKARLQEFDENGSPGKTFDFPITNYPGKGEMANILTPARSSVDNGKYYLNYLQERKLPVSVVSFPGLKSFEVQKGKIYELSIIREVDLNQSLGIDIKEAKFTPQKTTKVLKDNEYTLKTYYFGTSLYDNLEEKLSNLEVEHVKSNLKLRDFSHPNDVFESQRASLISDLGESKFHSVKDDYYAFRLKNRKGSEGFDAFDIMRMKRNIKFNYLDTYLPEKWIGDLHNGYPLYHKFEEFLNTDYNNKGGGYLKKVLSNYNKSATSSGEYGISDGNKWHYVLSGAGDDKWLRLTPEEIASKKIAKTIRVVGNSYYNNLFDANYKDPNSDLQVFNVDFGYDFLIQDLRSRIVINQMYWLSAISKDYVSNDYLSKFYSITGVTKYKTDILNWAQDNSPEGEFKSDDGASDFKWILDSPNNIYKMNIYTYIATEPGYRLSYHGRSEIQFPTKAEWGGLLSSKRDEGAPMMTVSSFNPKRDVLSSTEYTVKNINELSINEWYHIDYKGKRIRTDVDGIKVDIWGLETPIGGSSNAAQYYLYNPGKGVLGARDFSSIEKPGNDTKWNFINQSGGINITNDRYQRDDIIDKWFPYMIGRYRGSARLNNEDFERIFSDNVSTISEIEYNFFNPNSKYSITDNNDVLRDSESNDHWKIIKDDKFYRIVSVKGDLLYGHYFDHVGSEESWYQNVERNAKMPARSDRDSYYRRVWTFIPVPGSSNEYYIKNVYYNRHYLKPRHIDKRNEYEMSESKAIKIKITEVK